MNAVWGFAHLKMPIITSLKRNNLKYISIYILPRQSNAEVKLNVVWHAESTARVWDNELLSRWGSLQSQTQTKDKVKPKSTQAKYAN